MNFDWFTIVDDFRGEKLWPLEGGFVNHCLAFNHLRACYYLKKPFDGQLPW
jgi:hypothetical protein